MGQHKTFSMFVYRDSFCLETKLYRHINKQCKSVVLSFSTLFGILVVCAWWNGTCAACPSMEYTPSLQRLRHSAWTNLHPCDDLAGAGSLLKSPARPGLAGEGIGRHGWVFSNQHWLNLQNWKALREEAKHWYSLVQANTSHGWRKQRLKDQQIKAP